MRGRTLTRNWLHFGRVLRGLGFDAGPARMLPFLRTLTAIDMRKSDDLQTAVRVHFGRRRDELALLDRALYAFLNGPGDVDAARAGSGTTAREEGKGAILGGRQLSVLDDSDAPDAQDLEVASYSRVEALRRRDFDGMTEEEMAEVRRLIRMMRVPAGVARSRRQRRGGDERIDMRRLLRASLRYGGEPLVFPWRGPTVRPRPLVLLCDISGSMERYTRVLLNFAYAIQNASAQVEAFVLGGERQAQPTLHRHLLPHLVAIAALVLHHRARVPDWGFTFQIPSSSIAQVPLLVVQVEVHLVSFERAGFLSLVRRRV